MNPQSRWAITRFSSSSVSALRKTEVTFIIKESKVLTNWKWSGKLQVLVGHLSSVYSCCHWWGQKLSQFLIRAVILPNKEQTQVNMFWQHVQLQRDSERQANTETDRHTGRKHHLKTKIYYCDVKFLQMLTWQNHGWSCTETSWRLWPQDHWRHPLDTCTSNSC